MLKNDKLTTGVKKKLMLLCLLSTAVLTSSCATLNKQECLRGDWASIGYNDAIAGLRSHNQLQEHQEACAEHQVRPNNPVYFSGYQRGLQTFCTHDSGLEYGGNSSEYRATCPASMEQRFLDGYLTGLELSIAGIRDDIDELRHERRKKKRRLQAIEHQGGKPAHKKTIKKLRQSLESLDS